MYGKDVAEKVNDVIKLIADMTILSSARGQLF